MLSGSGIQHCHELWGRCRQAAEALIPPLAWELPYAPGLALENDRKERTKEGRDGGREGGKEGRKGRKKEKGRKEGKKREGRKDGRKEGKKEKGIFTYDSCFLFNPLC